ncbi:hypothetical protein [Bacteroides acidifaciens]|uniref:hypothetical protein n=1 Tax=Bacteroides acidifaciens TaxID=85831 RepID=UPI0026F24E81|nr:hypothetical protein [Bacteroides acidifaciens]
MNCCTQLPSGIFVDGIEILTKPVKNDFSKVVFSDDIYLSHMKLCANVSVWFDAEVILKSHTLEYTVRKDAVQIIQSLLKKSIPVYVNATYPYKFYRIWNAQCYDENVDGSVKAVMIPDVIDAWHNIDCIGVTNKRLIDSQMHFMYEEIGEPVTIVTGYKEESSNYPTKVKYSATFAEVMVVDDEPFELN